MDFFCIDCEDLESVKAKSKVDRVILNKEQKDKNDELFSKINVRFDGLWGVLSGIKDLLIKQNDLSQRALDMTNEIVDNIYNDDHGYTNGSQRLMDMDANNDKVITKKYYNSHYRSNEFKEIIQDKRNGLYVDMNKGLSQMYDRMGVRITPSLGKQLPDAHRVGSNKLTTKFFTNSKSRNNSSGHNEALFISRLSPLLGTTDLSNFISTIIKDEEIKIYQLRTKFDSYSSFYLRGNPQTLISIKFSDKWPDNVLITPFIGPLRKHQVREGNLQGAGNEVLKKEELLDNIPRSNKVTMNQASEYFNKEKDVIRSNQIIDIKVRNQKEEDLINNISDGNEVVVDQTPSDTNKEKGVMLSNQIANIKISNQIANNDIEGVIKSSQKEEPSNNVADIKQIGNILDILPDKPSNLCSILQSSIEHNNAYVNSSNISNNESSDEEEGKNSKISIQLDQNSDNFVKVNRYNNKVNSLIDKSIKNVSVEQTSDDLITLNSTELSDGTSTGIVSVRRTDEIGASKDGEEIQMIYPKAEYFSQGNKMGNQAVTETGRNNIFPGAQSDKVASISNQVVVNNLELKSISKNKINKIDKFRQMSSFNKTKSGRTIRKPSKNSI